MMADRLSLILAKQAGFQESLYGPVKDDSDRIERYKVSHMALIDELHEALHEMGWKPWATSRHFNDDAVKGELIDAWHFLMNLMILAGMTDDELFTRYNEKHAINVQRQMDGYDGVRGKCPACNRSYDDPAVRCTSYSDNELANQGNQFPMGVISYCAVYGYVNNKGKMMVFEDNKWVEDE